MHSYFFLFADTQNIFIFTAVTRVAYSFGVLEGPSGWICTLFHMQTRRKHDLLQPARVSPIAWGSGEAF